MSIFDSPTGPCHIDETRAASAAIDIPLLHPEHTEFSWHGKSCRIHHQRLSPGGKLKHPQNFYLVDPSGLYHEINLVEVRRHLTYRPDEPTAEDVALSFEKEPHQHDPEHLPQIILLCRP